MFESSGHESGVVENVLPESLREVVFSYEPTLTNQVDIFSEARGFFG